MSRREKIIVTVMIGSVIYGAYQFFSSGSQMNIRLPLQGKKNSAAKTAVKTAEISISEKDRYILRQASVQWKDDPFFRYKANHAEQNIKTYPTVPKGLRYSGYLRTENRMLAIISGMEYEVGETLFKSKYFIKEISPQQVVIALPGGLNQSLVPFQENKK